MNILLLCLLILKRAKSDITCHEKLAKIILTVIDE